ncbi:MAG TPA: hypothetical protein VF533_08535 [Solirubrobacteraceae bacterium]|jgi:hypothetical protein
MPEYDAFGREIGENPLEQLGWAGGGSPAPAPAEGAPPRPAPRPTAPQATPPPPAPFPSAQAPRGFGTPGAARWRRRRRAIRRGIFLGIVGAIGLAIWGSATSVVREARDAIDDVQVTVPSPREDGQVADETESERPAPPARPPKGLRGDSLVRPDNLRAALRQLRKAGGRIESLRLAPERLDAELVTRGGRVKRIQISPEGGMSQQTGSGFPGSAKLPISSVDPAAPARLVRAAARKMNRSTDGINYLLFAFTGEPGWNAYFKNGAYWQGDRSGRILRRFN